MTLYVKDAGTWKSAELWVKDGGTWKQVTGYVKDAGTWKEFVSALSVIVAPTKSIWDTETDPTNAEALVKVDSDGGLYAGFPAYSFYETWLDAGSNTQVWVQRTIISGTLSTDAGSGRLACTADRAFGVLQTSIGTKQCVIDLKFYDAASGGNLLDTQRVTLTAEVESTA